MGERGVHDEKRKQRRQSRGRLKSQWGGGAERLDKVKGIRVFILCFVIKKKKKALIRSWLRYLPLLCVVIAASLQVD